MDDLLSEFIDETMEGLSKLDADLIQLENDPGNKELLGNVFRVMHTIKGTCGFIGLPRLEKLSHAAENLLESFRSGTLEVSEQAMTVLFMAIDRVRYTVSEIHKSGAEPSGDDGDLIALIEGELSGASKTQVAPGAVLEAMPAPPPSIPLPSASLPSASVPPPEPEAEPQNLAPSAPPAAGIHAETPDTVERTPEYLRVQISVLEELVNKVSELVLTRNQLLQVLKNHQDTQVKIPFQNLNRIISDLQDNVMRTRMQPISNAWAKFPRLIRDLCAETGKKITLDMQGEKTELDRQVLELIKDPLTHMIRNACDHGIEMPEERRGKGKPEKGHILLKAAHEGGHVVIRILDDGKGLSPEKIGQKAVEKGLVDAARLAQMGDKEILNFIMAPGFSTADKITNLSGRGVGMDVVRANIEKIGGTIEISSVPGQGSSFTIQIPLTLAIISALVVDIDGVKFAVPQMSVQEVVSIDGDRAVEYIGGRPVMRLRENVISLLDGAMLFSPDGRGTQEGPAQTQTQGNGTDAGGAGKYAVIVNTGLHCFGIIVERIDDIEEIVIKPSSPVLKNTAIFSGCTILGNGQVIMILDPVSIARRHQIERGRIEDLSVTKDKMAYLQQEKALMLTFVAGTGMPKSIPLALVSRLQVFPVPGITYSGGQMIVTYNNQIIPLYLVDPDTQALQDKEVVTIILKDDMSDSAIGLVIDKMLDVIEGELDLKSVTERPGVIGTVILSNGMTTDVLDITHYLSFNSQDWFSTQTHMISSYAPNVEDGEDAAPASGTPAAQDGSPLAPAPARTTRVYQPTSGRPRVLLVDDSQFFRNMLYPILHRAGYDVILSDNPLHSIQLHDEGEMFDIVLSDIEMPHMNGYEFVEKMRAGSRWKDVPFIAITSHNTSADSSYGYRQGFDHYIGKFEKDVLLNTLKAASGEKA